MFVFHEYINVNLQLEIDFNNRILSVALDFWATTGVFKKKLHSWRTYPLRAGDPLSKYTVFFFYFINILYILYKTLFSVFSGFVLEVKEWFIFLHAPFHYLNTKRLSKANGLTIGMGEQKGSNNFSANLNSKFQIRQTKMDYLLLQSVSYFTTAYQWTVKRSVKR